MSNDRSIVGDLINFRGLVYAPLNENGVVFLFGKVVEDLNMYIEEIKPGFPDCIARRFTGRGWERLRVEFEYVSSNFQQHGHDPNECDLIICWRHDWSDCPIEVIELRDRIKELENRPIERPDTTRPEPEVKDVDDWFDRHGIRPKVRQLLGFLDEHVKSLDEECFYRIGKATITFYCPERAFLYVWNAKTRLSMSLFTRGAALGNVSHYTSDRGPVVWGGLSVATEKDLQEVLPWITESYNRIKEAIENNEPTSWYGRPAAGELEGKEAEETVETNASESAADQGVDSQCLRGELEAQFHEAMLDVYQRAKDECGYNASRFLQTVNGLGGVEAAKQLLQGHEVSEGFTKLWELGRLDISMEALVLDPRWQSLFTEGERAIARRRLDDCGYPRRTGDPKRAASPGGA